jgi:uncharacterized membrane protein (UPF0127 family)
VRHRGTRLGFWRGRVATSHVAAVVLAFGCDLAGSRQAGSEKAAVPATSVASRNGSGTEMGQASGQPGTTAPVTARLSEPTPRCVVPRADPPPPVAPVAAQCPTDPDTPPVLPGGQVRFSDAPSSPTVRVERAITDPARTRGLMYRTALGADQGMLFSWDRAEPRSFWMRNTCIPLDMLFIDADGTVVGLLEQVPTLNTLPRGVPCPAQHVLELNAGWARQHGVLPGQHVDFET